MYKEQHGEYAKADLGEGPWGPAIFPDPPLFWVKKKNKKNRRRKKSRQDRRKKSALPTFPPPPPPLAQDLALCMTDSHTNL